MAGLILFVIFLLVAATIGFFVASTMASRRSRILERLKALKVKSSEEEIISKLEAEELKGSFFERIILPVIQRLGERFSKSGSSGMKDALKEQLVLAGNPGNFGPNEFMALQLLVGVLLGTALPQAVEAP